MMNKKLLNKILITLGTVLFFIVLSYAYMPQVLKGKIVNQADISSWKGMTNEVVQHNKANPEDKTLWTNSMFGGMPTAAMYDDFEGDWTKAIYEFLLTGKRPATYIFIALLGGFLLMLSLGISWPLSIAGAIAIAFCSYNFQIIQVGHNTKMQAIAFMPWVLAGILFTYRSALVETKEDRKKWQQWLPKTVLGATLFALALSLQIKANHPQITYYLAIIIFIYAIALLVWILKSKERRPLISRFLISSVLLLFIGLIGISTNLNKLIPTYCYAEHTMRGGSELTPKNGSSVNSKGLDLDYATAWSYGIEEMPNLMIPNYNGGASVGELGKDSETYDLLRRAGQPNLNQVIKNMPLYWGPQPFTAGPMYMGAICIFLFILGLFLVKGKEKWWLLIATVIAILLSWGNHFMWFTKLWFNYAPMYNKFRTVSMALTVLQVTVPVLGFYVLDRITKEEYTKKEFKKAGYISYALTAGFCLLCVLIPSIAGSFTSRVDAGQPDILVDALISDRQGLLVKDALRSLIFITIIFGLILWAFATPKRDAVGKNGSFVLKGRMTIISIAAILLVLLDLAGVGKRYLNESHFVSPKQFNNQFALRPADEIILKDKDPDYRVLDISVNTFNDSHQSYHHKCIGGYSPAKLQRYQDLIEQYISPEINRMISAVNGSETISQIQDNLPYLPICSMLNTRYIIVGGEYKPIVNTYTFGNAWFVNSAISAATPDEEIALLGALSADTDAAKLRSSAIVGDDFAWARDAINAAAADSAFSGSIVLSHYAPNYLRYDVSTSAERAAVFSEIYYPNGWKAWFEPADGDMGAVEDGVYRPSDNASELELFRANWMLRGAVVPAGEGQIVMRFEPQSYITGEKASRASSITLILLLVLSAGGMFAVRREEV